MKKFPRTLTVLLIASLIALTLILASCTGAPPADTEPSDTADVAGGDTTPAPEETDPPADTEPPARVIPELDGLADECYADQGFLWESTALYIYSSNPAKRNVDGDGNSPHCQSSGTFRFYFDGTDMWFQADITDPTMFEPDTEYVTKEHNPWKTNSVEIWYCFNGKKLWHVDTDSWGIRKFTDDESRAKNYDDITFGVTNDIDNNRYHIEFRIPGVREDGTQLVSGDTVWIALQINDLFTDPAIDPSRNDNLASNGGHHIENFKKVVLP